ncbi:MULTISPECIES: DUF6704 family protein [Agromyces]|jgi:hypothetical protein|uniref:Uncharacterized protein n=1 Tax=Agromyces mediolanus TaxID=41986 RepID=A0A918CH59_AGRME|nr:MULTISPECIES: DUF6704 family protein [Agromyces]MCD1570152.1 hypothetical protein [Agromyces mediolanus]GGR24956.1 hypothetical protein GCM10010196_18530 [Agromyces mediolanus]GLJ70887.1 hypothetical protein GCM10017583_01420 [Agromyces mediolanus]GLU89945.1 hypothetical protein Agsp01_22000 [Agromyces sp. NBRC 114283]
MTTEHADPGHGHSPAAWTAVVIMLVAFTIGTVAFFFELEWLVWASAGLLVVGALVGWALAKAGYGVGGAKSSVSSH